MKRIGYLGLAIVLMLSLAVSAAAVKVPVWVSDDAGLMTQQKALELDEHLQELHDDYDLNIAIHTTNSLRGKSPQRYADDYYDSTFGAGTDGILFLLSMEDRDWYISTSGKAMDLLTDGEVYNSVDTALPYLSDGNYAGGFTVWLNNLPYYLDNEEPEPTPNLWISLVAGGIIALVVVLIMRAGMNTKRQQQSARQYLQQGTYRLYTKQDTFLYSQVSKTARPKNTGSSGGGGGRSHGGGGGKF